MSNAEPLGGAVSRKHTFFADCPMPLRVFEFNAKVIDSGDGDTCTVALEEMNGRSWCVTLRYESVSAPEMTQVGGVQCSALNKQLTSTVWAVVKTRGRFDQRSRLLGDLFMYTGKTTPMIDVSKVIMKFIADNGYGTGN